MPPARRPEANAILALAVGLALPALPARATDIAGVQPTAGGAPLSADFGGVQSFNSQAFYDTGASGILLSNNTADFLGIRRQQVGGGPAVFSDVGVVGTDDSNISEPLYLGLARFTDFANVDVPSQIASTYTQVIGPVRTQIGPSGGVDNPLLEDLDVFGVPLMAGKVVVFDPKPVNTFADTMRTYVYGPGTPFNPADRQFQLTIGGIGGTSKAAGFFVPELTIPTLEGNPITFLDAPVLVSDITVAGAFISEGGPLGITINDLAEGAFDWVTFDQPNGILGLQLPGAVPEPGSLGFVAFAGLALLRRRERAL